MGTIFTDTSYYQTVVTNSYPHPFISFRIADGTFVDPVFKSNYAWSKAQPASKLLGILGYYVFRPGLSVASQYQLIVNTVGAPDKRLAIMIDIESWGGQIGGNHSAEINDLATRLGRWLGSNSRVTVYGNQNDLRNIYPNRNNAFRLVVASYGSVMPQVPNQIAWQYSDGKDRWPVPAGFPRATAPFGSCDHNYSPLAPDALAKSLGLVVATPPVITPIVPGALSLEEDVFIRFINSGPKNNNFAVYQVSGGYLIYIDSFTYGWLGKPAVHAMDLRSNYWKLPVAPGTPDYRGK
jgi:hypothetical protein